MTPAELRALPLGTRMVVRYRLHGPQDDGRTYGATDALGELIAHDTVGCTVATARGAVTIRFVDIVAAKPVPPAPERRS